MVAPLVVGAAIAAVATIGSAIAQWKSSQAGQRATAEERARVQALLDKVQSPGFDFSTIDPEEYSFIESYVPEVAPYVAAKNPQLAKVTDPQGLRGQEVEQETLEELLRMARSGEDPLAQIERARSSRQAAGNAQSARATLDQQFARRGVAPGSGMQYGANLAAQSDAFQADALAGERAAEAAAGRRMDAVGEAGALGGKIYNREMGLAEKNAAVMNDFNQWLRNSQQDWANNAANVRNNAQMFNQKEAQRIADQNVTTRNNFRVQERDRGDQLLQRTYDNDLAKVRTSAGLSDQRVGDINASTVQRNTAVQGVGEGVSKVGMYAGNQLRQPTNAAGSQGQSAMYSGDFRLGNEEDEDDPLNPRRRPV